MNATGATRLLANSNFVVGLHKPQVSKVRELTVKVVPATVAAGTVVELGVPHFIIVGQCLSSLNSFLQGS